MSDEITLTLPRHKPFFRIAHLVLGGVAVRHDLTFESLEDLQLALAGLLEHRREDGSDITVSLRIEGDRIRAAVGPFSGDTLRTDLADAVGRDVGLARLLGTVVDSVELDEREGEQWVELTKTVQVVGA